MSGVRERGEGAMASATSGGPGAGNAGASAGNRGPGAGNGASGGAGAGDRGPGAGNGASGGAGAGDGGLGARDGGPDRGHRRPAGLDDVTVQALGKLSEALETVERVRGHLYSMHQLTGTADFMLDEAVSLFMQGGHTAIAERIERELIGRNVVPGRWTFQLVEEYDDGYYREFRQMEQDARDELAGGRRHLYEAELKERRRTHGRRGHEALPG
ncbi:hypothetical protein GCM10010168_53620 [Actinoplanes ianthinogenes]|uniref:Uncharacterized protein n=1 Tax=Actinoplanes ianthinogenes TaxID=122358 RepID=A0ABN6C884_9ACTN|nr:hypothetical protein Aiant_22970 [Actinoplanes ianthinogenes]GGR28727.1 hypothetical protein GCM10010168_53620 [Actinoplanes ianthinogenes]